MILKSPLSQGGLYFFLIIKLITFSIRLKFFKLFSLYGVLLLKTLCEMSFFGKPNVGMTGGCVCLYIHKGNKMFSVSKQCLNGAVLV